MAFSSSGLQQRQCTVTKLSPSCNPTHIIILKVSGREDKEILTGNKPTFFVGKRTMTKHKSEDQDPVQLWDSCGTNKQMDWTHYWCDESRFACFSRNNATCEIGRQRRLSHNGIYITYGSDYVSLPCCTFSAPSPFSQAFKGPYCGQKSSSSFKLTFFPK